MSTTTTTPASDAFIGSLTSMVNHDDISAILEAQTQMLSRFEKTNEMLSNFNSLSNARYEKTLEEFKDHTQTLLDMKKDLDSIFRRIRFLKSKLSKDYPDAFETASKEIKGPDLDEEEEDTKPGVANSSSKLSASVPTITTQMSGDRQEEMTHVLSSIN